MISSLQGNDPILHKVLGWVKVGLRLDYMAITDSGPNCYSAIGYSTATRHSWSGELLQLIVPGALRNCVLGLVHGQSEILEVNKTFQWFACPVLLARLPHRQQIICAPIEHVIMDIFRPFLVSNHRKPNILVAMDYFTK